MACYQELGAQYEAHKHDVDPPRTRIHHRPRAVRRSLLRTAIGAKRVRQERNEAFGNRAGVRIRRSPVRQSADQSGQLAGRSFARQLSQFGSLLPRVHIRSRQPGEHAHQHAVFVLTNRREQKVIEFGAWDRHRCGCHLIIDCGRPILSKTAELNHIGQQPRQTRKIPKRAASPGLLAMDRSRRRIPNEAASAPTVR